MTRWSTWLRLLLPLALALAAAVVRLRVGEVGYGVVLAALTGGLLGLALVLLLESVAQSADGDDGATTGDHQPLWPERERQLSAALDALRLDAALGNLDPSEAERRERALLSELDPSEAGHLPGDPDHQKQLDRRIVEAALARRRDRGAS